MDINTEGDMGLALRLARYVTKNKTKIKKNACSGYKLNEV